MKLFESSWQMVLIELLRAKIISKRDIENLSDMDMVVDARLSIIKAVEDKLSIFIYANDLELLVRYPYAFSSFLLAVSGQALQSNRYAKPDSDSQFVVPRF